MVSRRLLNLDLTLHAVKCYDDLRQRALECNVPLRLQTMVTNAKVSLGQARQARKLARNINGNPRSSATKHEEQSLALN